jgi:hypothetical protein
LNRHPRERLRVFVAPLRRADRQPGARVGQQVAGVGRQRAEMQQKTAEIASGM